MAQRLTVIAINFSSRCATDKGGRREKPSFSQPAPLPSSAGSETLLAERDSSAKAKTYESEMSFDGMKYGLTAVTGATVWGRGRGCGGHAYRSSAL